ncbi:MAG: leucine-rich repeat protein [Oscillospiraceae bacterium]|nr:leucine-rich repeat protein [Oscillospiraceae bacterium]
MKGIRKAAVLVSSLILLSAGTFTLIKFSSSQPGNAYIISADDCEYGGLVYVKNADDTITVKGHTDDADLTDLVIPDEIDGCPVTEIADKAFYGCRTMSTLSLGKNIKVIGESAFAGTGSGSMITLNELTVSCSIDTMADGCFLYAEILKLNISDSVQSIPIRFTFDLALSEIIVDKSNNYYSSDNGVLFNYDKTTLIKCPAKTSLKSFEVPDSVESISDYGFYNCISLKRISLGKNTSVIGKYAFAGISYNDPMCLDEITLPDNLEALGENAFHYVKISRINIPAACSGVPAELYSNDHLTYINVEDNNKSYSSDKGVLYNADKTLLIRCPQNTSLMSYKISDFTTSISAEAFYKCYSIASIDLGKNTAVIGKNAFSGDSIKKMSISDLTVSDCIEAMDYNAFNYTDINKLTVPGSVRSIPDMLLNYSTLSEINVAQDNMSFCSDKGILYSNDKSALIRCPANTILITYTVDYSTVSIKDNAFANCTSIKKIDLGKNVSSIGSNAFNHLSSWKVNTMEVVVPDDIEQLGQDAFSHVNISKLIVPESVITIPERFYSDALLTEITVDENNKYFSSDKGILYNADKSALIRCPQSTSLLQYSVPENTKTITDLAFSGTKLQSIYIPQSVTSVGTYTFKNSSISIIKGIKDSYAQSYAESRKLTFTAVDVQTQPPVTGTPAETTTPRITGTQTGATTDSPQENVNYDINSDGKVNIFDELKLKQYILSGNK